MFAISYRREDSAGITGRIHDRLSNQFGSEKIFMDLDSIPFGVDFRVHISKALESCRAMLVVIGPRWFGTVQSGGRRIDNPADYVRLEVKHALARNILVIPLLVEGAQMPEENMLPDDLKDLAYRNAITIDSGRDFNSHILRLCNSLRSLLDDQLQTDPLPNLGHDRLEAKRKAKEKRDRQDSERQSQADAPTKSPTGATKENPYVNSLGVKFVPVPITGGPTDGKKVLFGIWDTRVQDYRAYSEANPGVDGSWKSPGFEQGRDHPVVNVSWDDAKAFCVWLTEKERKSGRIGANEMYRMPSDHEWSCGVGIGDQEDANATPSSKDLDINGVYPWGTHWPPPVGAGNYHPSLKVDDYEYTSPVGSFRANQYGLYDMGGNVWQWCEDWYDGEQKSRVVRGASWGSSVREGLWSSRRYGDTPDYRYVLYGFRCVLVSGQSSG